MGMVIIKRSTVSATGDLAPVHHRSFYRCLIGGDDQD
jgi:hypothetical protein